MSDGLRCVLLLAKELARRDGITGGKGGWLYRNGRPFCQGYFQLARRYMRAKRIVDVRSFVGRPGLYGRLAQEESHVPNV
jgi:hypothetical protein